MQQSSSNAIGDLHVDGSEIDLVVDFTGVGDNEVFSDSESENGEFNEDSFRSEFSDRFPTIIAVGRVLYIQKRINPNPYPPPLDEIASLFHPHLRRSPHLVLRRSPPPLGFGANDFSSYADFLAGSFPSSSSAGLGSPATQGTSVPQPQPASIIEDRLLNELLVAPGRELLPKLSPNGEPNTSWFRRSNRNAICKSILKCFHSLLELPYPTYAHVPLEIQKMWLRSFAQDWNWDPAYTNTVRTAFNLQARKQYTSNVTEWKKKWRLKKDKPICLNQDVWDGFKAYWQLDATAHIAATNSGNRRSKRGGKGEAVHNGGAKTREEREIEMGWCATRLVRIDEGYAHQ
ncbi:hypothetical protein Bca4012_070997 [Brassica carinata]